jgi:hypothetical protein
MTNGMRNGKDRGRDYEKSRSGHLLGHIGKRQWKATQCVAGRCNGSGNQIPKAKQESGSSCPVPEKDYQLSASAAPPTPGGWHGEVIVIQLFLGFVVLGFALSCRGLGGVPGAALGRPRIPASRIASKSASRYNPADPMYLKGFMPFLSSLLLTAAEEIPNRWAISSTVIPSIYNILPQNPSLHQSLKVKKSLYFDILSKNVNKIGYLDIIAINVIIYRHNDILLYKRIVKIKKYCKFLNFFWSDP